MDVSGWKEVIDKGNHEGIRIVKSRCVYSWLLWCTSEFNAVLSWCRVLRTAHGFFDSMPDLALKLLSMVVAEQALVAEEDAFEHSLAMCLVFLQKRQRYCLKWHCHSCCVSLLSLPSLEERSELGCFWLVLLLPELALLELLESLELLFLLLFLSAF